MKLEIFLNEASYILSRLSVTFHLISVGLIIFPLKTVSQQNCPPFETTFKKLFALTQLSL